MANGNREPGTDPGTVPNGSEQPPTVPDSASRAYATAHAVAAEREYVMAATIALRERPPLTPDRGKVRLVQAARFTFAASASVMRRPVTRQPRRETPSAILRDRPTWRVRSARTQAGRPGVRNARSWNTCSASCRSPRRCLPASTPTAPELRAALPPESGRACRECFARYGPKHLPVSASKAIVGYRIVQNKLLLPGESR